MRFLQPVVHERTKNCTPWSLPGQKRWKWRRGANPDVTGISDGELCQRDHVSPGYTRSQIRKTPDLQKYTSDTNPQTTRSRNVHSRQRSVRHGRIGDQSQWPITAQCFVHSHRAKNKTREEQTPNMIVRSHRASCCQFRFKTDLLASRLDQAIMY